VRNDETTGEHKINFKAARITMTDSIKHFTGFDISGKSEVIDAAKGMGIDVDATMERKID
jgi:lysyl-tRNA synthetase class 2